MGSIIIYTYNANNFTVSDSYKFWNEAGTKIMSGDSTRYYFHTVVVGIYYEPSNTSFLMIYPNPSSEKITIERPAKGSLSILNLNGKQLLQQEITEPRTTIDVSGFTSGVYVVRMTSVKTVMIGKFIKQ